MEGSVRSTGVGKGGGDARLGTGADVGDAGGAEE